MAQRTNPNSDGRVKGDPRGSLNVSSNGNAVCDTCRKLLIFNERLSLDRALFFYYHLKMDTLLASCLYHKPFNTTSLREITHEEYEMYRVLSE